VVRLAQRSLEDVAEAFQREWTSLEEERDRLRTWADRLGRTTEFQRVSIAEARKKLEMDREAYRKDLRKVYDRELAADRKEKALNQRERALKVEEDRQRKERADLDNRQSHLEDLERKVVATGQRLEEERKALSEREASAKKLESSLARTRESLEVRERWVKGKEAELSDLSERLKAEESAPGRQAQEAAQKALEAFQEEQRTGVERITAWAGEVERS